MKATVVRNGSHQGVAFSEVQEVKADGTAGPISYAVPGEFPLGTVVEILVTRVESEEVKEETEAAKKAVVAKEAKIASSK